MSAGAVDTLAVTQRQQATDLLTNVVGGRDQQVAPRCEAPLSERRVPVFRLVETDEG